MKTKYITIFSVLLLFMLLFLCPLSALTGAKNGLLLWFQTILPALLPFAIISKVMIQLDITNYLTTLFYPIFKRLFSISKYGCYPVIIGMLCGYPMGAKACADLIKSGKLEVSEAQRILAFCNNASPMFILSYITIQCLGLSKSPYILLLIIYGSAYLVGILEGFIKRLDLHKIQTCSLNYEAPNYNTQKSTLFHILDNSIIDSFELLTKIGGYIVLFSLGAQILNDIPLIPMIIKVQFAAFLEITTGASAIMKASFSKELKIVLITAFTAFGGLSSFAQTKSVIADTGLSLKKYFISKLINGLLAAFITLLWLIN